MGKYFIEPATATMHPQSKWRELGVSEDDLIEVSPQYDDGNIKGFGLHLDIRQLPKFKVFHPAIEQMLSEAIKRLVMQALESNDDDKKDLMLWQAKELSTIMLNYYEHKENPEVTPEVSAEIERAIEEARNATKQ